MHSFPLTPAQLGVFFRQQVDLQDPRYNLAHLTEIAGPLDIGVLESALRQTISEADAVQVRLRGTEGLPHQILESVDFRLPVLDVSGAADPLQAVEDHVQTRRSTAIDLDQWPLFNIALLRTGQDRLFLFLCFHHLIFDGYSFLLFIERLAEIYSALKSGAQPAAAKWSRLADLLADDEAYRASAAFQKDQQFWSEYLANCPEPPIIAGDVQNASPASATVKAKVNLSPEKTESLRQTAQRNGTSWSQFITAAMAAYLARVTGQTDEVILGMPVTARVGRTAKNVPAMMSNVLPLRVPMNPSSSMTELVRQVSAQSLRVLRHQRYRIKDIRRDLERLDIGQRLFGPIVNIMPGFNSAIAFTDCEVVSTRTFSVTPDDLTLHVHDEGEAAGLRLVFDASAALYSSEAVRTHLRRFMHFLEHAIAHPDAPLHTLPLLLPGERAQLGTWSGASAPFAQDQCIHQLFERQVTRTPDATALVFEGESLSYARLNGRANRLAHQLIALGVGPEARVALCMERGPEMVIALLAILKAGAAYVPFDPAYPGERLAHMLRDAAPVLLIADAAGRDALGPAGDLPVLDPAAFDDTRPDHDPQVAALGARSLAYVIYTSGSTGAPKGVMVEHGNIVNLAVAQIGLYGVGPQSRVVQFVSTGFDVSVADIFMTLGAGAALCLPVRDDCLAASSLIEYMRRHAITHAQLPPALLQGQNSLALLPRLQVLVLGGESPGLALIHSVQSDVRIFNAYGPTETTVCATAWCRPQAFDGYTVPIGRPLANTRIYLLDAHGQLMPPGAVGELHIGGAGVARGYLNRLELTAERFLHDPFSETPGARMYRTGDLARWLPDGNIEFLGRNDHQVKIRGYRIELGEIEARLTAHPAIREAVVLARETGGSGKQLVAYYTAQAPLEAPQSQQLRAHLQETLPDYMVPAAYVMLDALPLTPNGKVNRRALPAPHDDAFTRRDYEPPIGDAETRIAAIWSEVLGRERVGRHDNFFELGGHSLLAVSLIERMRQAGVQADVRVLFSQPSVAALASAAQSVRHAVAVPPNGIPAGCETITPEMLPLVKLSAEHIAAVVARVEGGARNVQDIYPLAPLHEGMLFHHIAGGDGDPYLQNMMMAMPERVELARFVQALQTVIARHDILRTAVLWEGLPEPVQVVWREARLIVEEVELSPQDGEIEAQLARRFDPRYQRLDVRHAPMMRLYVARDPANGRWLLQLLGHHMVMDYTALEMMLEEIEAILRDDAQRLPVPLPYRNFVAQARLGMSQDEHEAYFRDVLADVDEPTLPYGLSDVQSNGLGIAEFRTRLAPTLNRQLREEARKLGVSVASLFHLAWAQVLARVSGREDVVFGTVLLGRMQGGAGADRVLGMFINTLPIRIRLHDVSVGDAVRETHTALSTLLHHEHASLALAQRCSGVAAPLPLFSALLNYRHGRASGRTDDARATASGVSVLHGDERTNYPLLLSVNDFGDDFELVVQADTRVDASRVAGYMDCTLDALAVALTQSPALPVRALEMLPLAERERLLVKRNEITTDTPQTTVMARFEAQVEQSPDAVAVVFEAERLTYAELNARANQLAHHLIDAGVKPDDRVAICVQRGIEMMVGVLGILKAGAGYVPLDPGYPVERLAYMLHDCAPVAVLAQASVRDVLGEPPAPIIELSAREFEAQPTHNPVVADLTPRHLAYVIYTSGSTGQPKGVMIEHRNIVRLFTATDPWFEFGPKDVWTLFHSFAFDFSVWEIWGALLYGGRLVIVPKEVSRSPQEFYRLLCEEGVTILNQTPSAFRQLIAVQGESTLPHRLRQVVFGGEALEPVILQPWYAREQNASTQLVNMYGITETTVHVTYRALTPEDAQRAGRSPIGGRIPDLRLYVLDGQGQPVPEGVTGEIHVGGAGVARGYLNRADLTAQRFVHDPFSSDADARMYKSGDLGRWLADGTLEYLGRNDDQVKVRGFRIELGEIEAKLLACDGVREAVVIVRQDSSGDKQLVGYVVGHDDAVLPAADLREQLSTMLADYMVPGAFVNMKALPLTQNGKLDRRALPAPDRSSVVTRHYEAPQGEAEIEIARIWQELLGVPRIGRHDDFFALGGHSLKVITSLSRIAGVFDKKIAQLDFYRQPTVAGVAGLLARDAHAADAANTLVPMLARGSAPTRLTVVCAPYAGASATVFRPFADALCARDPTLAVRAIALPGNELGSDPRDYVSVVRMAQACADELVATIIGDIAVYGHCVGSFLAFELARQIEARGRKVALLAVAAAFPLPRLLRWLPMPAPWSLTSDSKLQALIRSWGGPAGEMEPEVVAFMMGNFRRNAQLTFEYEKRRTDETIAAPILCIVSRDDPLTRGYERRYRAWSALSDRTDLAVLSEGQHYFIGTRPGLVVDVVCQYLQDHREPSSPVVERVRSVVTRAER
ncbi:non-ribosomal peptide synthetase [Caballeronia temeraria]|uniref:Non-ribosomal peptide synthetase n=1 Tax=Caballeronia temeraria TaxID=1777137 RepID=A0A158C511_9BURK|nr:non-ribosomal peptide synthetase [Caballeronia temeraria]SAK77435.1 non-ribosomal peptide synthetase [Caballeronia temeraria]